jgi:hypothetical protein
MCSARTSAQVAADDRVLEPHTVPVGGQYALMHQGVNGVWYVSYGDAVDRKVARVAQQPRDSEDHLGVDVAAECLQQASAAAAVADAACGAKPSSPNASRTWSGLRVPTGLRPGRVGR